MKQKFQHSLVILMTLVLALTLASPVWAETTHFDDDAANNIPITKKYELTGEGAIVPAETITFQFTNGQVYQAPEGTIVPQIPDVTVEVDGKGEGNSYTSSHIDLSNFDTAPVGMYVYEITEAAPTTPKAGVTYTNDKLYLKVTVFSDNRGEGIPKKSVVVSKDMPNTTGSEVTNNKLDKILFTNQYDSNTLTVKNVVTGNLADVNKKFDVTITLTPETGKDYSGIPITYNDPTGSSTEPLTVNLDGGNPAEIKVKLKNEASVIFKNLPVGITYTVKAEPVEGYTVSYNPTAVDSTPQSISKGNASNVTVTYNSDAVLDTGIILDNLPYIIILVVAVAGLCFYFVRRKTQHDA